MVPVVLEVNKWVLATGPEAAVDLISTTLQDNILRNLRTIPLKCKTHLEIWVCPKDFQVVLDRVLQVLKEGLLETPSRPFKI